MDRDRLTDNLVSEKILLFVERSHPRTLSLTEPRYGARMQHEK